MTSISSSIGTHPQTAQNAKSIVLIGAIASALTAALYLYQARLTGVWQVYVASIDIWILVGMLLTSWFLIRREQKQMGVWLMLSSMCVTFAVNPFILSGWGLILGIGLAVLITFIATQSLPGQQGERAILLGLVFGVFIIVSDLFGRDDRMLAPQIMIIALSIVLTITAIILGISFVRQFQQFRMASRLTALVFMIALPIVTIIAVTVTSGAIPLIDAQANENLHQHNAVVESTLITWLDLHSHALTELVAFPDIVGMDPAQQQPILQTMAQAFPNLFLVHTINLSGMDMARSDGAAPKDYHDRQWFLGAKAGVPFTLEVLISRTNGKPSLSMSTPIRNGSGEIIGVASIVSALDDISAAVDTIKVGKTGYVFVVDNNNQVVAHPDPNFTSGATLHDFSNYPPVVAMRQGATGIVRFSDEKGMLWRAYVFSSKANDGWGIIAQEPEAELLAPQLSFQRASAVVGIAGLALLWIVAWLAIHSTLRPIDKLTETVESITAGDLTITADITSQDEIGILARAFNNMTFRVRELISGLEYRVSERTKDLERRTAQLQAAAEVGNTVASFRNLESLLNQTARLVSLRFGFYHTGIFLLDETGKYAVLHAAASEGGQIMLARGHKLEVGQKGIVGNVAQTGESRIALDVGHDAVFFNNPNLPNTHSEIALPINIGGRTIGVLDVQSTIASAFTEEDATILKIVADQLAVAIENTRLIAESEIVSETARRAYGEFVTKSWRDRFRMQAGQGFKSVGRGNIVQIAKGADWSSAAIQATQEGKVVASKEGGTLHIPLLIRGQAIGVLKLEKPGTTQWTTLETEAAQSLADQLSGALDTARLYDESQRQATKEKIISDATAHIGSALNIENILQATVDELSRTLGSSEIVLQLSPDKTE